MREIRFRAWDKDYSYGRFGTAGRYKMSGYVMRLAPYHPYANKRGYVPEHRLIMENSLGRYLEPRKELIHHLNGKRDDNRLENLKLSNPKDHAIGHIGQRNENGQFACISKEFIEKKFRLFDVDRNITQIYSLNELISKTFRRGKFEYRGEFTGLKDKNGKEIYEGDIVNGRATDDWDYKTYKPGIGSEPNYSNSLVEWDEKMSGWKPFNYYSTNGVNDCNDEFYVKDTCEVIGNIYENPELLKQ